MVCVQLVPFNQDKCPNPPTSASAGRRTVEITVSVALSHSDRGVKAEFVLLGDTSAILWPATLPKAMPGHELWKHTCFELFIADPRCPAYWEYNFSPSRQWAIYAFRDYRQPAETPITAHPTIETPRLTEKTFSIELYFPLEAPLLKKSLSIGACAVIEMHDGSFQYFALTHCAQRPDFHQRDSFLVNIPWPRPT